MFGRKEKIDPKGAAYCICEIVERRHSELQPQVERVIETFEISPEKGWEDRIPGTCVLLSYYYCFSAWGKQAIGMAPYFRDEAKNWESLSQIPLDSHIQEMKYEFEQWNLTHGDTAYKIAVNFLLGKGRAPFYRITLLNFFGNMIYRVTDEITEYIAERKLKI